MKENVPKSFLMLKPYLTVQCGSATNFFITSWRNHLPRDHPRKSGLPSII